MVYGGKVILIWIRSESTETTTPERIQYIESESAALQLLVCAMVQSRVLIHVVKLSAIAGHFWRRRPEDERMASHHHTTGSARLSYYNWCPSCGIAIQHTALAPRSPLKLWKNQSKTKKNWCRLNRTLYYNAYCTLNDHNYAHAACSCI
jgi:hypothetical protein